MRDQLLSPARFGRDRVHVCRNVEAAVVSACDFNDAQEVT